MKGLFGRVQSLLQGSFAKEPCKRALSFEEAYYLVPTPYQFIHICIESIWAFRSVYLDQTCHVTHMYVTCEKVMSHVAHRKRMGVAHEQRVQHRQYNLYMICVLVTSQTCMSRVNKTRHASRIAEYACASHTYSFANMT